MTDQEINSITQRGIEVVFLSMSSSANRPHLQALSNRGDSVTGNVPYLLNALAAHNVRACAGILSDSFTGSPSEMQRDGMVDSLVDFNASRTASDAGFTCVATDLEGYRTTAVYDLWKQFHSSMRERIASRSGNLKLLAWIQGPDVLIAQMYPADRSQLIQRESITRDSADSTVYDNALRYFASQNGKPIFDAVIPMWYYTASEPYYRFLSHNVRELQGLGMPNLYLVAGVMARNANGPCCPGCVTGSQDLQNRLQYNDTQRQQYPNLIGTGVFLWPFQSDWAC